MIQAPTDSAAVVSPFRSIAHPDFPSSLSLLVFLRCHFHQLGQLHSIYTASMIFPSINNLQLRLFTKTTRYFDSLGCHQSSISSSSMLDPILWLQEYSNISICDVDQRIDIPFRLQQIDLTSSCDFIQPF
eukprot:jgi/Psemu1/36491/gm1.36491_g